MEYTFNIEVIIKLPILGRMQYAPTKEIVEIKK